MFFSAEDYEAAEPVFILELSWRGVVHRFAKVAVNVSKADGTSLHFTGGLEDFEYREVTDIVGINVDQDSISAAVIFNDVNFVQEWRKGFTLDGARAELSLVMLRDGVIQQTYENRQRLFVGFVSGSVFGDPLEPKGFVAFSIEAKPYDFEGKMLVSTHVINERNMENNIFSTNDAEFWQDSRGKAYPFVFGYPGEPYVKSGGALATETFTTPAYIIAVVNKIIDEGYQARDSVLLIAGHRVDASNVMVCDANYAYDNLTVYEAVDNNGVLYSYVIIDRVNSHLQRPQVPSNTGQTETKYEYWVQWGAEPQAGTKYGGGILNSHGTGVLQNAGDLVIHALNKTNALIDYAAWEAVKPILNSYKFSGYINDFEVSAWDWAQQNILKFLPVEARAGVDGIRPLVSLMFIQSEHLKGAYHITMGSDFELDSAIEMQTDLDDIINEYVLQFVWDGKNDNSVTAHVVGAERLIDSVAIDSTSYAWTSQNRYDKHKQVEHSYYVYDRATAAKVCKDKIRMHAFAFRQFDAIANSRYGYLNIGDVITLSSDTLYLTEAPVLVVAKEWVGTAWRYTLHIEDNPNTTERTL
jgi:hypothetical protein